MIEIKIGDYSVKIDDEFEKLITAFNWKVYRFNKKGSPEILYAQCNVAGKPVYMHRLILDCSGKEIDHINRDGLDNRKENLRIATRSQNSANKPSYGGSSKFKGVCKANTKSVRYRAWIMKNKKSIYLGSFKTEIEAAVAYNKAAFDAWGDFAMLNKID
jgi:hypothetical protein